MNKVWQVTDKMTVFLSEDNNNLVRRVEVADMASVK